MQKQDEDDKKAAEPPEEKIERKEEPKPVIKEPIASIDYESNVEMRNDNASSYNTTFVEMEKVPNGQ